MTDSLVTESFWSEAWLRHIEPYLAAPPRCGYWLERRFSRALSLLEIAGGSCRDSRYLAQRGYKALGTDFDERTLRFLERRFPDGPLRMQREDAFAFSLADKSVDVTFSNGFWVLFRDDEALYRLAREQQRISSKFMVIVVHNALNTAQRAVFAEKAKSDELYGIRFFEPLEVVRIVQASGVKARSIEIRKFGGVADVLFQTRVRGLPNPFSRVAPLLAPKLYELQPWSMTERIACVVAL